MRRGPGRVSSTQNGDSGSQRRSRSSGLPGRGLDVAAGTLAPGLGPHCLMRRRWAQRPLLPGEGLHPWAAALSPRVSGVPLGELCWDPGDLAAPRRGWGGRRAWAIWAPADFGEGRSGFSCFLSFQKGSYWELPHPLLQKLVLGSFLGLGQYQGVPVTGLPASQRGANTPCLWETSWQQPPLLPMEGLSRQPSAPVRAPLSTAHQSALHPHPLWVLRAEDRTASLPDFPALWPHQSSPSEGSPGQGRWPG